MSNDYVIWAAIFLGVALILFFLELFVPSGGLIGLAAAGCLVTGIVMLFKVDTTLGLVGALVSMIAVPFIFALAIKVWPNTPIARLLLLKTPPPAGSEDGPAASGGAGAPLVHIPAVGARGVAVTDLRPVGICLFDGPRTECLSEHGVLRAGTTVVVTSVDGIQVKVREAG